MIDTRRRWGGPLGASALWLLAGCGPNSEGPPVATSAGIISTSASAGGGDDASSSGTEGGAGESEDQPATSGDAEPDGSTGVAERCDDGIQNGEESDVDCGGPCTPCDDDLGCGGPLDCVSGQCEAGVCVVAPSCAAIKQGRPDASTGVYAIAPDGAAPTIDVWCDMDRKGGGWTLTFAANGETFDVANAVPVAMPGSVPALFESSAARYQQYAAHGEEMFVCTTGEGETPNYEIRTFEAIPRFWDQSLDNAEIFVTGTAGTPNASATEYCAGLVWGGCNLDHYGYAVFQAAFGTANWGRWSGNTYYGPSGGALDCFGNGDQTGNPDAWFWHFVR